jgi:hypothetical protein
MVEGAADEKTSHALAFQRGVDLGVVKTISWSVFW